MKTRSCALFFLIQMVLFLGLCSQAAVTFNVSPTTVSNTYVGNITLQITGLTNTETVVVQKFIDANADGIIDPGDWMVQQFTLTDGQASIIGGVTNLNVPGDLNSTNGVITAQLNFHGGDFVQTLVGTYAFKLSSPGGHFAPLTNLFTVTNFPYAQTITGTVYSNGTATPLPDAAVVLFPAPRAGDHGPGTPMAGVVANNSGSYSIQVPLGTYVPAAFRSNYLVNYSASKVVTLTGSGSTNVNLAVTNSTATISGQVVDAANNTIGLPGVFFPVTSNGGLIAGAFTDTNGNFTAGVMSGSWGLGSDNSGLLVHGFVGYNSDYTNVNAGATGVIVPFPKATALFYGTVKDSSGNALPSLDVGAMDNNNSTYQADGFTDANGNYFVGVVGGLSNDPWELQVSTGGSGNPTNFLYSQPLFDQNGGTNLAVSQVAQANLTAIIPTNSISGHLKDNNGNPLTGIQVGANGNDTNGVSYQTQGTTDSNGYFVFPVAGGIQWNLYVNCGCTGSDCSGSLSPSSYQCPNSQYLVISGNNPTNDFIVQPAGLGPYFISGQVMDNNSNPIPGINVYASDNNGNHFTTTTDPGGDYLINNIGNGTVTVSLDCGQLAAAGYSCPGSQVVPISNAYYTGLNFTANSTALQITTSTLTNAYAGAFYSYQLQASGGTPPYTWSLAAGSQALPGKLSISTGGLISGVPTNSGLANFIAQVVDANSTTNTRSLSVNVFPKPDFNSPSRPAKGQFAVNVLGSISGQNYTLQYSSNLSNWISIYVTNSPGSSFSLTDTNATNSIRFYRLLIGP